MPTLLTTVPAMAHMSNVTAFVDVTNIAQYTQKQVAIQTVLTAVHAKCKSTLQPLLSRPVPAA